MQALQTRVHRQCVPLRSAKDTCLQAEEEQPGARHVALAVPVHDLRVGNHGSVHRVGTPADIPAGILPPFAGILNQESTSLTH